MKGIAELWAACAGALAREDRRFEGTRFRYRSGGDEHRVEVEATDAALTLLLEPGFRTAVKGIFRRLASEVGRPEVSDPGWPLFHFASVAGLDVAPAGATLSREGGGEDAESPPSRPPPPSRPSRPPLRVAHRTQPKTSYLDSPAAQEDALVRAVAPAGTSPDSERMLRVCLRVWAMLDEKNRAYGNSALEPLRVFSSADAVEQIRVRIDDKLSRLARGHAGGEDATADLMGYLVLLKVAELDWSDTEGRSAGDQLRLPLDAPEGRPHVCHVPRCRAEVPPWHDAADAAIAAVVEKERRG